MVEDEFAHERPRTSSSAIVSALIMSNGVTARGATSPVAIATG